MDGKTFIKTYIKEDPSKVLRTQFVLVSSTIRKMGKYEKQIINANTTLYPSERLILDYDDYKNNTSYHDEYMSQLDDNKPFIATLVKYAVEDNETIVFLCGHKESKYAYLKILRKYVMSEFDFPVYDYKKLKEGKEKIYHYDESKVLSICKKILKKAAAHQTKVMLSTENGRIQYFNSLSKKQLKRECQRRDLYFKGMTKSEMIDMLLTFV